VRLLPYCAYAISLTIFALAARLPLAGVAATALAFLVMTFAGVVSLRYLVPQVESLLPLLIFGSVFGSIFARICLIITGLWFGPSFVAVGLALGIVLSGASLLLALRPVGFPRWGPEEEHELRWILALNAAALFAMALPLWGAGHPTSRGYAFVPHFNEDFLNHVAYTAELARSLPPENPYFAGEPLHYYWFYHLWPAAVANLSGITAKDALVSTFPPTVFLFIAALAMLVRRFVAPSPPRQLATSIGLFAFSYIGILFLLIKLLPHLPGTFSKFVDTDHSYLSHSWFRDFLYEPHAVTALTYFLLLLYLDKLSSLHSTWSSTLVTGLLLGIVGLTDLFIALTALLWFATTRAPSFIRGETSRVRVMMSCVVALVVFLAAVGLGLFPLQSGGLRPGVHPLAKIAPALLLVELGPLFIFGAAGVYLCFRRGRNNEFDSMALLMIGTLFVACTVKMPLESDLVIRKAIKVLQLPLVVFSAVACARYLALQPGHWVRRIGLPVILGGSLTLATDIFQRVDLTTKRNPPTTYYSPSKMKSLEWIREHTPPDAVVQEFDEVRPGRSYADTLDLSISALGERRSLFGNYKLPYILHVNKPVMADRVALLLRAFSAKDPDALKNALDELPVSYLLVDSSQPGPHDALRHLTQSAYLAEVFRAGEITLLAKNLNATKSIR
jgi:hypothetical protein